MPMPTDGGNTCTFKIRATSSRFDNSDNLTVEDVAASLNKVAFRREELVSPAPPL